VLWQLSFARIINIPDDYPTIAEGIEASVSVDTVLVAPGVYEEDVTFGGKNILLTHISQMNLYIGIEIY